MDNQLRSLRIRAGVVNAKAFMKWIVISVMVGFVVGGFSILFGKVMNFVTVYRVRNEWVLYFLPVAGILIVNIYKLAKYENNTGTNEVLDNIREAKDIPFRMAPLIFVSTALTHMFGGSAGREGAALQMGGSIGNAIGKIIKLDDNDKKIMVMCGMSAAFAALFGTPMAASIFAIEVCSVGIMHYSALVPCVFSAITASRFAIYMGIAPEVFSVKKIPAMSVPGVAKILGICIICAIASCIFCIMLHTINRFFKEKFENEYVRIIVASVVIIIITKLIRTTDYNGIGIDVIERAMEGEVKPYAFFIKMLLTAITLGAGFKGGEIVPSFFIGATLGAFLGEIMGLPSALCAAVGMTSVFCGATNCPIASILISFELFGYEGAIYYMMAASISYMISGYYGLYSSQMIVNSKIRTEVVDRRTH